MIDTDQLSATLAREAAEQRCADRAFLALTLWREVRGEKPEVIAGVAQVIINRVAHPSWWGNDVQSVLFKRWQFSSLTDPKDVQLTIWPLSGDTSWIRCLWIANDALDGKLQTSVGAADSYYDISIAAPAWATDDKFIVQLDRVKFYKVSP